MSISEATKPVSCRIEPAIPDMLPAALEAYRAGRFDEARQLCLQTLSRNARHGAALHLLGMVEFQGRRLEGAEKMLRRALAIEDQNADVLANLGLILQSRGKLHEAAACYGQSLRLRPEQIEARNNLGCVYRALNRTDEAEECFSAVLKRQPDFLPALDNLGAVLMHRGALDEAMDCCRRALALDPGNPQVQNHAAIVLQYQGRYAEALAHLDGVCAQLPDASLPQTPAQAELRWTRAMMQLALGDFAAGWTSYEWRWWSANFDTPRRNYAQPLWQGEALGEGRLLLWSEQGVGDEVQFAGLLPEAIGTGNRILLECAPRLAPLLARSFPQVEVGTQPAVTDFAAHLPLGSLPGLFRRSEESFAQTVCGYLKADPAAVERLRARYDDGRRRGGLAWHTTNRISGARRSVDLARFQPLFAQQNLHWVSLQYGDFDALAKQAAEAGAPLTIDRAVDQMKDLDLFAAQIAALDLVITIDNSTAHLAAALGRPVWLLLPVASDWRWMRERDDSPWYPSLRIFRQSRPGDWSDVLLSVTAALEVWRMQDVS